MEEDCGGGQGLSWAVEPRRERERERNKMTFLYICLITFTKKWIRHTEH